ncbi:hypothetical protein BGZ51_001308 [Haplosporangium sp. Z 767]|nr:hypothetical protein BGZ51_001308 [Haplosporangium sp. Z 767]KAF9196690.1 hypothetical protein BGZ50_007854 [Haplosporangium sp. Z 11]
MQLPNPLRPTTKKPLSDLPELIDRARIRCGIPGMSIAILYKGKIIFAEGFGKRNEQDPFTAQTLAPIGSLTKAFTATVIGELVAEGKMDWDKTPVNKYLPEFEVHDPILTSQITLVDMLSHRTGLPEIDIGWQRSKLSRRELIKRLRYITTTSSKLGTKTIYNNIMYAIAGEAAANVSGLPYEDLVRTRIIQPLNLSNTGFSPMEMKNRSPNHARSFQAASLKDAQDGRYQMQDLEKVYFALAPAGDMYSDVFDLVRWGKVVMDTGALEGRQVLNKDSIQETLKPHSIFSEPVRGPEFSPTATYGLGWWFDSYKGHVFYRHTGSIAGFRANMTIFPYQDLVIAQLSNIFPTELGNNLVYHIADELFDLCRTQDWLFDVAVSETQGYYTMIADFLKGNMPEKVPNQPRSHVSLQEYVGVYSNPVLGDLTVRLETTDNNNDKEKEGCLYYTMGSFESKLVHYHYDAFKMTFDFHPLKRTCLGLFHTGADGKVMAITTDIDNDMSTFEFKRQEDGL